MHRKNTIRDEGSTTLFTFGLFPFGLSKVGVQWRLDCNILTTLDIWTAIVSSVRSSYSHPDLLLIHHHHPPTFSVTHRSSTLDFHFLSHYSYIKAKMLNKGNHWTHLLTSWIPWGFDWASLMTTWGHLGHYLGTTWGWLGHYFGKTWQDSGILWHTLAYSGILRHSLAYSGIL